MRGAGPAAWTLSRKRPQVKTDVEELSPTRVKLTIEVPFEELKPQLDKAYREVAKQVRVPGFRPGHVPPRVIDQRIGRGAVLEQAVNEAVPELYSKAVAEHDVVPLSQPDLEITKLDDGKELAFTAEVDVRPSFDLPDLDGIVGDRGQRRGGSRPGRGVPRLAARAVRVAEDRGSARGVRRLRLHRPGGHRRRRGRSRMRRLPACPTRSARSQCWTASTRRSPA